MSVAPLTQHSIWTAWSPDAPMLALAGCLVLGYALGVTTAVRRNDPWRATSTAWFLLGGVGTLVIATCSFLGTYSRTLFWPLAVQDVLLLTVVPVGLTMGKPISLWRLIRSGGNHESSLATRAVRRLVGFPLTGSLLAVTLLLLIYTTGWDAARLQQPLLLGATRVALLVAGSTFLWPLLGVDGDGGSTSYPVRAVVAVVDGLLDALPGLAVLGTKGLIAAAYYAKLHRVWGPPPLRDQQLGGLAMIGLSELVGLPALVILLVAWVRNDATQARRIDAKLDLATTWPDGLRPTDGGDVTSSLQRPWWEVDPGPLSDRAERYGWPSTRDDSN